MDKNNLQNTAYALSSSGKTYLLNDEFAICETTGAHELTHPLKLRYNMIMVCLSGLVKIGLNLQNYTLAARSMIFIPRDTILEHFQGLDESETITCLFTDEFYAEGTTESQLIGQQFFQNPVSQISANSWEEVVTVFRLIERKLTEEDNLYKKKAVMGYISVLVSSGYNVLRQSLALSQENDENRSMQVFRQFLLLVQQHYREHHNIMFYADKICLTPKYLSKLVQQASGKLAGEWIAQYLLLEAKTLLSNQESSMLQISELLNFSSPSAFIAFFKKHTGMTPKKYRSLYH